MGWIDDAKRVKVPDAADALGLTLTRVRGAAVDLGPCPACGAEKRGSSDKRRPVGLTTDRRGWRCFRCDASGDALDLVAVCLHGSGLRGMDRDRLADVYRWYTARGWCSYDWATDARLRADRAEVARAIGKDTADKDLVGLVAWHLHRTFLDSLDTAQATAVRGWFAERGWCEGAGEAPRKPRPPRRAPPAPKPEPEPTYPPADELSALWDAALPVVDVPDVAGWLDKVRRINPAGLAVLDAARAIPADADNVDNAHKFLDFLMDPEVIAGITNYVSYPNGNADAMPFVDEAIRNDKAIYPSEETMKGLFTMKVMPPKVSRVRNRVWTKLKTGQ